MRRSKASEARVQLAKLFDATSAYFNEDHVDRGSSEFIGSGGSITETAPHRCPHPTGQPEGSAAGITPPEAVNCADGPGGRCVPAVGGGGAGYYELDLWDDNNVWNGLNFKQDQGHFFHYNFTATNGTEGFGTCQFTASAFGDLDNDGMYSTYERTGAGDENGVNGAAGLYIDHDVE
jgi:type IV pilus assembly protein PilA